MLPQPARSLARVANERRAHAGQWPGRGLACCSIGRRAPAVSDVESGKGGLRVTSLLAILDSLDADLVFNERLQTPDQVDLDEFLGLGDHGD